MSNQLHFSAGANRLQSKLTKVPRLWQNRRHTVDLDEMPELPEVETVRRGLLQRLPGKHVTRVKVLRNQSIGAPSATRFASALTGQIFSDIKRRGKYLLFHMRSGAVMVAHLRMSGRLLIAGHDGAKDEHIRVRIFLDGEEELIFEDMRVFGRLWFVPAKTAVEKTVSGLAGLGVEPLESMDAAYLQDSFKSKKQPIKATLLDQTIIAGIGNIYADESLFLAGINPRRAASSLSKDELSRLTDTIKVVLTQAIELGGSSLRNYTDSEGVNGNYQEEALVYGRYKQSCRQCGTGIERIKLAGRSSHFCPKCQPARRAKSRKAR